MTTTVEPQTQTKKPKRTRSETLILVRQIWPWVFLAAMVIFFTVTSKYMNDTNFLGPRSIQGILVYATQILLIALGETMIIIAAGIDLSVGYVLGLAAVAAAMVMQTLDAAGYSPWVTIPLGMLGGIVVAAVPGWINGLLVAKIKVPPFITTLGMGYVVYGVALLLSGGYPVAKQPSQLGALGNGYIFYYWPGHGISFLGLPEGASRSDLAVIIPILPNVVLVTIIVTLICWFLLAKTQFGQHLYAIGGNFEAATRAGIPVKRTIIKVYILAGVLPEWPAACGPLDLPAARPMPGKPPCCFPLPRWW
jgi:ribose transport system permease protein